MYAGHMFTKKRPVNKGKKIIYFFLNLVKIAKLWNNEKLFDPIFFTV